MNDEMMFKNMIIMQDILNKKINPNWVYADYPWYRACYMECSEMIDHSDWKWWKKQKDDRPQMVLEMVDVFHFVIADVTARLSKRIDKSSGTRFGSLPEFHISEIAQNFYKTYKKSHATRYNKHASIPLISEIERFMSACLLHKMADLNLFFQLLFTFQIPLGELYLKYIGKNVLNRLRQDNGYKEGVYKKIWHGKEDNWHLEIVLRNLLNHPSIIFSEDSLKSNNTFEIVYKNLNSILESTSNEK